jgi:hypothetical protein
MARTCRGSFRRFPWRVHASRGSNGLRWLHIRLTLDTYALAEESQDTLFLHTSHPTPRIQVTPPRAPSPLQYYGKRIAKSFFKRNDGKEQEKFIYLFVCYHIIVSHQY